MLNKIHIIINPEAGNDEPILSYINDALKGTDISWEISITKEASDAFNQAKKAIEDGVDAVVAYGGDGTVMEVAQALYKTQTSLYIIPGGTANVLAKDLGIPVDTKEAIRLLKEKLLISKQIDMGMAGDSPFLIRINCGLPADMVTQTERQVKDKLGMAAYGITAIKNLKDPTKKTYKLQIDGETMELEGIALVIANSGHTGVAGMSLAPEICLDDGLLDVILIAEANLKSIIEIAGQKPAESIKQWKAKEVNLLFDSECTATIDDLPTQIKDLKITIVPSSLNVLVPITSIN